MKMNTSNLHLEILDKNRIKFLDKLTPHTKNFVLSGGTALALQLGHRKSFDFDLFTEKEISSKLLEKLSKDIKVKTVSVDSSDELTFFNNNDIKVTFLYYPFKSIHKTIDLNNGIKLAPVDEIAIQKAYTIGRSGEYRDYFDLYTILNMEKVTLDQLIKEAEKKYKSLFNTKLFLEQLVYFDDLLNLEIIPVDNKPIPSTNKVKDYFQQTVKEYLA